MDIKNIILDLGGVIIDISYEATARVFKESGITNFDELYSKKKQEIFFDNYEKGIITDEEFRNEIRKYFSFSATDEQIDHAWNALLFSIPPKRMDYLESLKNKYRLFLLSNTNKIHIRAFTKIINLQYGENAIENLFDKIYYSCFIQKRKPDAEIFNHVLEENNLRKEETIFIDDSIQHVEGARKAGLTAYFLDVSKTTLEEFLPELLEVKNFKLIK